jgi:competence protein ComEC
VARGRRDGWLLSLGAICGSLFALLFHTVPPGWQLTAGTAAGLLCLAVRPLRPVGAMALACCWSLWNFQSRLDDRLPADLAGARVSVTGVITSIPQEYDDFASFRFAPRQTAPEVPLPRSLLLRWYRERPELAAGQHWNLEIVLKPPWGRVNFQGPDKERWLFAAGIGGLGTVRGGTARSGRESPKVALERVRQSVLRAIARHVEEGRSRAIVRALVLADQSEISRGDRDVLALTGTAHLLAISGLHIGLAAGGGMLASRILAWFFVPVTFARGRVYILTAGGGLLAAAAYAALAGFGVPTVRALLMVTVVLAALATERSFHPVRPWLLAMMAVLLGNPFAPLTAGFWLSFAAVAALLLLFAPRPGRWPWWRSLPMAQAAVMLLLLPFSAVWFQGFSAAGFLANLVAIPWVSFLVVPLALTGTVALAVSGGLAGLLWSAASDAIALLWIFLEIMAGLQGRLTGLPVPSMAQTVLAVLGAALLLLPRGLPIRWIGAFMVAPLLAGSNPGPDPGSLEVEVLDVGQGTAVLVTAGGNTLLYDSGPGDGAEGNLVASVIAPALAGLESGAPDRVVISHGDLDHAGGLATLRQRFPHADFRVNLADPPPGLAPCSVPLHWQWSDLAFDVLHPTASLPYLGNDSSCVLSIGSKDRQLLLSGDISAAVEQRLVSEGLVKHELLLVPHHGSKTSSSPEFLMAVRPRIAVATASLGNRFGFPKEEVEARYRRAGVRFWSTGGCGALRLVIAADGEVLAASARRQRTGIWRWPPAAGCP